VLPALPPEALQEDGNGESSAAVRSRVVSARQRQYDRYHADHVRTNAELPPSLMARHCILDANGRRILAAASRRLAMSARGYDRVRKLARTIADLENADAIGADHLAEALQFRSLT
jgi:magnesium chelatase family protein